MTDDWHRSTGTKMRQWPDKGDTRNKGFCAHCGGPDESRDHNPSKVFLDDPLPANLPVASSCIACNSAFSGDEEYVACLLECIVAGEVNLALLQRLSISRTLAGNRRLQAELLTARREVDGQILWNPDTNRVRRIALKMARGLMDYELNEPRLEEPECVRVTPLGLMTDQDRRLFEGKPGEIALWPEVGSRAFHRLILGTEEEFENGWIVVQRDRFRYRVTQGDGERVRMVLREYLALEVVW